MDPIAGNNAILWQRFPAGYFALERRLIKQFDQIYFCHSKSAKFYQHRYPSISERIAYLRNPVDDEIFYPLAPEQRQAKRKALARELNLPEETRFLLFAGRLHPQKDPFLLINAFAILNAPNVHLLIAGDGELAEPIQREISRCQLSNRVTMVGAIEQKN